MHRNAALVAASPPASPPTGAMLVLALTLAEAARALSVSESTLRRLTARGEIPSFKIAGATRWSVAALAAYVERQSAASSESDP